MTPKNSAQGRPSIAIIDVWLGPWPSWTQAWLLSCYHNPTVNWLIFCEQPPPNENQYPNVHFIPFSLAEFERRAADILGFECKLPRPHKICDYRPVYGLIFAEELAHFDFWGWGDNDVIWGNIRKFITDEHLAEYDILTALRCCIAGQFTIIRKGERNDNLWRKIPDYEAKLKQEKGANVCERGINAIAIELESRGELKVWRRQLQITDTFSEAWDKWAQELETSESFADVPYRWLSGPCDWHNGRLRHRESNEESMLFHFMYWKWPWKEQPPVFAPIDTTVMEINATGIWPVFEKNTVLRTLQELLHQLPSFAKKPSLIRDHLALARGRRADRKKRATNHD